MNIIVDKFDLVFPSNLKSSQD